MADSDNRQFGSPDYLAGISKQPDKQLTTKEFRWRFERPVDVQQPPPIPPIPLSDYRKLQFVVNEIKEIKKLLGPRPVETTCIDGKIIAALIDAVGSMELP